MTKCGLGHSALLAKHKISLEDICIVSTVRLENIEISHFKMLFFLFNFNCASKSEKHQVFIMKFCHGNIKLLLGMMLSVKS